LSGDNGAKAETISGYTKTEELRDKLKAAASRNTSKILNLSELKGLLKARSIIDRVALAEILKTSILSLYSANVLTEDYVKEVGYAWNRDALPTMANEDALAASVNSKNITEIKKAMGLGEASSSVNTYLDKISAETSTPLDAGLKRSSMTNGDELQKAFLTAIAERMLAKNLLDKRGINEGLADAELEVILGHKLLAQKAMLAEGKDMAIKPETFVAQNRVNAATFYGRLKVEIIALCGSNDPKAINAIVALIPLAERKLPKNIRVQQTNFDAATVTAVLKAG
jgi:hypothetical protein